ncbi:MAG: LptA/OstA family protein [Armatimonas sp.]
MTPLLFVPLLQTPPVPTDLRRFRPTPTPNGAKPGAPGTKAAPPQAQSKEVTLEWADELRVLADGSRVLTGNVRLTYQNYKIRADRARFDENTQLVTLEGSVKLDRDNETVFAEKVTINRQTQDISALSARTILSPAQVGQNLLQPLEVWGASFTREGQILRAKDGFLTTCDLPDKHYKIGFREAVLYPKQKIVLKGATVYIEDKAVLRIGYLTIPVTEEVRYSWLPLFGRTNEEGYFVKAVIGYSMGKMFPGLLHVDWMEKKGVGLGFDQAYKVGNVAAGTATLYTLRDRSRKVNNLNGRLNHEQRLSNALTLRVNSDFQNNSYQSVSSDSSSRNTTLSLTHNAGTTQTALTANLTGSDSGTSKSSGTNYSFTQTRRIGERGTLSVRLNGNNSDSTFGTGETATTTGRTEQLAEIRASGQAGTFQYELSANKQLASKQRTSSGTTPTVGFSGTERLPELTLTADPQKLGRLGKAFPARLTFGVGKFVEPLITGTTASKLSVERYLFAADMPSKTLPLTSGGRLSLSYGGTYRQFLYPAEKAALYTLNNSSQLSLKLGARSSLNLSYGYLRPYGGMPVGFRLDQTGSNNNLSLNLSRDTGKGRLNIVTGYDIQRAQGEVLSGTKKNPWQNMAIQATMRPSGAMQTRFTTAYDINSGKLVDLTNSSRWRYGDSFGLDLGLRYDPRTGKLATATQTLSSWLFDRATRIGVSSSYNGFSKKFDYKNFALSHRYHDYEISLSYLDQPFGFRTEKGFNIGIRLLAFPAPQTGTAGRFGTSMDTGFGQSF